jgi:hypothetical protein
VDYQPKFNVFVDFAHYEQGRAYDDPTHDELGARMSSTPGITTRTGSCGSLSRRVSK